jgi:hypothetical protein
MKTLGSVAAKPSPELVVARARDPGLTAGLRDVAEFLGPAEETKPKSVYPVVEGHRTSSQVVVS